MRGERKGLRVKAKGNLGSYCHDLKNPFTERISVTPPANISPFKDTAGLLSVM